MRSFLYFFQLLTFAYQLELAVAAPRSQDAPFFSARCVATLLSVNAQRSSNADFLEIKLNTRATIAGLDGFLASSLLPKLEVQTPAFLELEHLDLGLGANGRGLEPEEMANISKGVASLRFAYQNQIGNMRGTMVRGHHDIVEYLEREKTHAHRLSEIKLGHGTPGFWQRVAFYGANHFLSPILASGGLALFLQTPPLVASAVRAENYFQIGAAAFLAAGTAYLAKTGLEFVQRVYWGRDGTYAESRRNIERLMYLAPESRPWYYRAEELFLDGALASLALKDEAEFYSNISNLELRKYDYFPMDFNPGNKDAPIGNQLAQSKLQRIFLERIVYFDAASNQPVLLDFVRLAE